MYSRALSYYPSMTLDAYMQCRATIDTEGVRRMIEHSRNKYVPTTVILAMYAIENRRNAIMSTSEFNSLIPT